MGEKEIFYIYTFLSTLDIMDDTMTILKVMIIYEIDFWTIGIDTKSGSK